MQTIQSFTVNHDKLKPGMYLSRIDGDCVTYDIRMVTPNAGIYLENDGLHTFEHLFATYVRNTPFSDRIIYVGPMGCRTGFYFITRDSVSKEDAIRLVQETCAFILSFRRGDPRQQTLGVRQLPRPLPPEGQGLRGKPREDIGGLDAGTDAVRSITPGYRGKGAR